MKKIIALLLLLGLVFSLSACSREDAAPEETPAPVEETASASDLGLEPALPPASATDTAGVDMTAYETALSFIGSSVEELYEACGEPLDSQYAASCEEEGAEDGMLFYDGFYVWSLRTEESETVRGVYLNPGEDEPEPDEYGVEPAEDDVVPAEDNEEL